MPLFNNLRDFYYQYERPLAHAFMAIDRRGFLVDQPKLSAFNKKIKDKLHTNCEFIASKAGKSVIYSKKDPAYKIHGDSAINLSSPDQLVELLKSWGLKLPIPKSSKRGKESTAEEHLFRLFGESQNEALGRIMNSRELNKMLSTYGEAKLLNGILYGRTLVTGTKTGRRSSKQQFLGYGANLQNLPKHSELGLLFRECIVARPGHIFLMCDQRSAEDWIVQGIIADISGDLTGYNELLSGVNRHKKLAARIFGKPESSIDKESILYYLGKKTRHAGNYDMYGKRMSGALAAEGVAMPAKACQELLDKFHTAEPSIRKVFHAWTQQVLCTTKELTTPIGRKRTFFGLRPHSDNSETFREAYAYIPQSTIGDNTGLAILYLEDHSIQRTIADWHDAVVLEVEENPTTIINTAKILEEAFDRILTFPNGFSLKIPIEFETGFNLKNTTPFKTLDDLIKHYQPQTEGDLVATFAKERMD